MNNINKRQSSCRQVRRLRKDRIAITLAAIAFFVAGLVYAFFSGDDDFAYQPSKLASVITSSMKEKINILVLGVDEREDDVGRSDTTFVITIDTAAKKVTMLSIPRDTRVKIAGHGWDKINHAYAFGGSKLSKSSIENLLGIPIDYTVVMNFSGFTRMIDAIGGVTIDVDKRMYYSDPYDDDGGLYIDLHPGVQKLNGKTAIQYVRYRDEEGDIGRVARQQKFLKALLQEFTKPQIITKLPDLISEFAKAVKTDMPTQVMVKLIPVVSDAAKSGLDTEWVSGTPIWIQDVSYWLPDIKNLRAKVAQIQGITSDDQYMQTTERLAYEYDHSVPREIKTADAPPVTRKNANINKQAASVARTDTNTNSPAISKSEAGLANGQTSAVSKGVKNPNGQSSSKTDTNGVTIIKIP